MNSFALLTTNAWRKNDVEVIEYGGEIWINQGHLQEKLGLSNSFNKTQYYPAKKCDAKYKSVVNINIVVCLLKMLWQWT